VRLNAVSGEKSIVFLLLGKQLQILTTRSVKNEDVTVQAHWRLNSLNSWLYFCVFSGFFVVWIK